jgi:hypothetical protein
MWLALGALLVVLIWVLLFRGRFWTGHRQELEELKLEHQHILDDEYERLHSILNRNRSIKQPVAGAAEPGNENEENKPVP